MTAGLDVARVQQALKAIDIEIDRIRQKKPSAAELQRTKDYLMGNFRLGFEQPRTRLFYFGLGVLTYGRIVPAAETAARIADVSAGEVLAVVNTGLGEMAKAPDREAAAAVRKIDRKAEKSTLRISLPIGELVEQALRQAGKKAQRARSIDNLKLIGLYCHALMWSIVTFFPLMWFCGPGAFAVLINVNTLVHLVVDHMKANIHCISLIEDQLIHLAQVIATVLITFAVL